MKFFRKYGVALAVTAAMILLAVMIGKPDAPKADNPDYYGKWIADDANLLSDAAERAITGYNEQLDEKYGSIVGLVTVDSWGGADPESFTYERAEEMGFGEWDFVLALSKRDKDFYFAFGAESGYYANAKLETAVIRHMTDAVYGSGADTILPALYADLAAWYDDHIDPHAGASADRSDGGSSGGLGVLLVFLLIALTVVIVISAASRASCGGSPYIPVGTPRYRRPYRYAPPSPPRPSNFGGASRPSGFGSTTRSSSRGFGGSSRGGSFGGGSRGGFGGSSRGGCGGFGGRR